MKCSDRRAILGFFAGAAAVFLIFAALQGVLRHCVDLTNAARRPQGDRAIIPDPLLDHRRLAAQWFRNTASAASSETWVIGSSISLMGIDSCDVDGVSNYSRPLQNLHEVSGWLPGALSRNDRVKHVMIEVSIGAPTRTARSGWSADGREPAAIFDAELLWLSVKRMMSRLTRSGRAAPAQRLCVPRPDVAWPNPRRKINLPEPDFTRLSIREAVAAVAPWCSAATGKTVTFFLPPVFNATVIDAAEAATGFAYRDAVRSEFPRQARDNPGCELRFLDLTTVGPRDTTAWYDRRHFRPEFGVQVVFGHLSKQ